MSVERSFIRMNVLRTKKSKRSDGRNAVKSRGRPQGPNLSIFVRYPILSTVVARGRRCNSRSIEFDNYGCSVHCPPGEYVLSLVDSPRMLEVDKGKG